MPHSSWGNKDRGLMGDWTSEEMESDSKNRKSRKVLLDGASIDQILTGVVKPTGFWQFAVIILLSFATSNSAVISIFVNTFPQHRCKLPPEVESRLANTTYWNIRRIVETFSPYQGSDDIVRSCEVYSNVFSVDKMDGQIFEEGLRHPTAKLVAEKCPSGYVYEYHSYQYPGGIVAEWNLVCDRAWEVPFNESVYMVGMFFGFIIGGWISDWLGRRPTIIYSCMTEFCLNIFVCFSPNHTFYIIFRLLTSITFTIRLSTSTVFITEFTTPKTRSILCATGSFIELSLLRAMLAAWAYVAHEWRLLTAMFVVLNSLVVPLWFILPESPKWLAAKGDYEGAARVLFHGYLWNTKVRNTFTNSSPRKLCLKWEEFAEQIGVPDLKNTQQPIRVNDAAIATVTVPCNRAKVPPFADLFNKGMAKITILSIIILTCQITSVFGMLFYATSIRLPISLVVFVNGLSNLPGSGLFACLYHYCKYRKRPLFFVYLCTALTLWTAAMYTMLAKPDSDLLLNIFTNVVILLLVVAVRMAFVYIPELYEPLYRNRGFGLACGLARIGALAYPVINLLDIRVIHGLPVAIYATIISLQLLFLSFLPDTTGESRTMLETHSLSDSDCRLEAIELK